MEIGLKARSFLRFIYVVDIEDNKLSICRLFADDSSLQHYSYYMLDSQYNLSNNFLVL